MKTITKSVVVDCPLSVCVIESNNLEKWPQIMPEYKRVEIVGHEGNKIWFKLSHENGSEWTSWRMVFVEAGVAVAERFEPKAPFEFMQICWSYRSISRSQTEMSWTMSFALPEGSDAEDRMGHELLQHTEANQVRMKHFIEETWHEAYAISDGQ